MKMPNLAGLMVAVIVTSFAGYGFGAFVGSYFDSLKALEVVEKKGATKPQLLKEVQAHLDLCNSQFTDGCKIVAIPTQHNFIKCDAENCGYINIRSETQLRCLKEPSWSGQSDYVKRQLLARAERCLYISLDKDYKQVEWRIEE